MHISRFIRPLLEVAGRSLAIAALVAVVFIALARSAIAEPQFPELTGRIVDNASLLKPEDRAAIEADLKALEAKSSDQIVVVTLPSLQGYEIEDFGYQLGRKWGIGQQGKNNGVLLIVAPNERRVRIETGRGLEPLLTDLMSKLIIENSILPEFRRGDYSAGIRAGVRDIKDVLTGDEELVEERQKRGRGGERGSDWISIFLICFWLAILAFIIWAQFQQAPISNRSLGAKSRARRGWPNGQVIFDPSVGSGTWGRGGNWSGGDSGGGFSGGGGDFGGGGASGRW